MNKTSALLLDSYRELNAKRLFWIVLALSGLVVGAFAIIGIKNDTITILWFDTPIKGDFFTYVTPATLYKDLFAYLGIPWWLGFFANILALVSTAGVFPDFIAAGSIDLYLSKPISRLRLFFTKYVGGLLFVTLQVTIFALGVFLLLGTRGHSWQPAVFLAIPLVVILFSYLFSICVLIGVLTRSTIAALLLTLLLWFTMWGVQVTEVVLLRQSIQSRVERTDLDQRIEQTRLELINYKPSAAATQSATTTHSTGNWNPLSMFVHNSKNKVEIEDRMENLKNERAQYGSGIDTAHAIAYGVLLPLPKTSGTTELMARALRDKDDEIAASAMEDDRANHRGGPGRRLTYAQRRSVDQQFIDAQNARSATWTLGTSLAFEAVIMAFAAWLFCRRDY